MHLPRQFGRYLLVDKIATGGMAEIYEARLIGVEGFEKPIAIKQILPHWSEKEDFAAMLIDEAKIAVRLNHPNIVQVYELGKERDQYYIAMELVEGVDLRELQRIAKIKGERLELHHVVWIMSEVTEALVYAHELKSPDGQPLEIVHRDISPQNVLTSFTGQVKMTDFGIAKAVDTTHETVTGTFKGKFAYMSPEQATQAKIDQRSDLFSLGILFYELATGTRLFAGGGDALVLERVRNATVPQEQLKPLPASVSNLIMSLLSRDPSMRPQTAAAVRDILREIEIKGDRRNFSSFLQGLLAEEIGKRKQRLARDERPLAGEKETRTVDKEIKPDETKVFVDYWREPEKEVHKRSPVPVTIVGAILAIVLVFLGSWLVSLWKEGAPRKVEEIQAPLPSLPVPPEAKVQPKEVVKEEPSILPEQIAAGKPEMERPKEGSLSVQAMPWGYVYIDKAGKAYETPVTGLELAAGPHNIEVVHPDTGEHVTGDIEIREGRNMRCLANFGAGGKLDCR